MNNNLLQFVGKTLIHFQKTNSLTLTFNEMSLMQKQFLLNEHLSSVVQKLKSKFPELVFYSFDFSYFPDLQKSTVETLVNSFGASLQELNISHLNSMDDKTLKNIFNACTSLKNFIADHCTLLTEKSFEAIPKSLESLSLKFCTGINTKKLVQLLKKNSSWKLINLQDSGFNESQADELKKSFPKTQVLHGKSTISNPLSYSFRLENE